MTEQGGRAAELAAAWASLDRRVAAACVAASRPRRDVTVIAVTKTFPASDVRMLAGLGAREVGENRDQEAEPKHAALVDLGLRWHFVGALQRNKCRSVASYADVVHSVDRDGLIDALGAAARRHEREIVGLVQVSLDPADPPGRAGAAIGDVPRLADRIAGTAGLRLGGVMAVAPLGVDPDPAFERLAAVADAVQAAHPAARVLSAGMSGDLEAAVRHGATHLRVGTALLGRRPRPVG